MVVVAALAGCTTEGTTTDPSAELDPLGIARVETTETKGLTTVRGLDANGVEVARLKVQYGEFTLTPPFTEDYDTPTVDGRSLDVRVQDQHMMWQTAGYEPVLRMPAIDADQWKLAAFVDDPRVKPVLDRWQIGFEPFVSEAEAAFTLIVDRGHSAQQCNNVTSCGTAYNGLTIGMCGGGAASLSATRIIQVAGGQCGLYSSIYNQVRVNQCCPQYAGGPAPTTGIWRALKTCPSFARLDSSTCGTPNSGQACKGCQTYEVIACTAKVLQNVGTCEGVAIKESEWNFGGGGGGGGCHGCEI